MSTNLPDEPMMEDPNALLEKALIEDYFRSRGLTLEGLEHLPKRTRKRLMAEATRYASLKLTELEARARFVDEVHSANKASVKA